MSMVRIMEYIIDLRKPHIVFLILHGETSKKKALKTRGNKIDSICVNGGWYAFVNMIFLEDGMHYTLLHDASTCPAK